MMEGYKYIEFLSIPSTWDSYCLGSEKPIILKEIRNGLTVSQNKNTGKYKVTRIETISNETIDEERVRFIDDLSLEKLNKYLIRKGQILFSHINSDPHLGKTAIAEKDYDDLLHGMNLLLFEVNRNEIEPEFLNFLFKLYRQIGVFIKIRSRAVNQSSINQNKLKNLQIPLPPLPEQRKISYVLSTIQKSIEQQDKLIQNTTELKKALMQKLFTEGTKGEKQKQTEIGLVPESWEVVEFPKFALLQRGKDLTKNDFRDGNVPVAGSNGIIGYHNVGFVPACGVTIGRSGTCGKPQFYNVPFWAHNTSLYVKDFLGNDELFTYYYLDFLNLGRFKTGASVPTLDRNSLNTLFIALPKKVEQKDIAFALKTIDEKQLCNQKNKQSLIELFKTLLHELMTGQRRVNEIDFKQIVKKYQLIERPLTKAAEQ